MPQTCPEFSARVVVFVQWPDANRPWITRHSSNRVERPRAPKVCAWCALTYCAFSPPFHSPTPNVLAYIWWSFDSPDRFSLSGNQLVGEVPSWLASNVAGSTLDMNCYLQPEYAPHNPICNVTSSEKSVLLELYADNGGANIVPPWPTDPDSDPCFDGWTGVGCSIGAPSHVTYGNAIIQSYCLLWRLSFLRMFCSVSVPSAAQGLYLPVCRSCLSSNFRCFPSPLTSHFDQVARTAVLGTDWTISCSPDRPRLTAVCSGCAQCCPEG